MPNWVSCRLRVYGEDLDAFAARVSGEDDDGQPSPLDFEALLPTPARLLKGHRYSDTAQGRRALQAYARAKTRAEKLAALERHPCLVFIAPDGPFGAEEPSRGWYYWRLTNWGTRGVVDATLRRRKTQLVYDFLTAWSPPSPFVDACARRFPTLTFELVYHEPGNCFAGYERWRRRRKDYERRSEDPDEIAELLEDSGLEEEAAFWLEINEDEETEAV